MSHIDYNIRLVPGYGYLPIVTLTLGASYESGKELYRGDFCSTATDAFHAALRAADLMRGYEPDMAAIIDAAEGRPHLIG